MSENICSFSFLICNLKKKSSELVEDYLGLLGSMLKTCQGSVGAFGGPLKDPLRH